MRPRSLSSASLKAGLGGRVWREAATKSAKLSVVPANEGLMRPTAMVAVGVEAVDLAAEHAEEVLALLRHDGAHVDVDDHSGEDRTHTDEEDSAAAV